MNGRVTSKSKIARTNAQTPFVAVGYAKWMQSIKDRVCEARQRAALSVNSELMLLYWDIGHEILRKQEQLGWGTKVVEKMAADLKAEFPGMAGFSRSNLMYMRSFASAWTRGQIVQAPLGQLPWYHHLALIEKLKSVTDRCKEKNSVVVEYSLKGLNKPLAVATYELERLGLPSGAVLQDGFTKVLCSER